MSKLFNIILLFFYGFPKEERGSEKVVIVHQLSCFFSDIVGLLSQNINHFHLSFPMRQLPDHYNNMLSNINIKVFHTGRQGEGTIM